MKKEKTNKHNIVVYSTPSCPYCTIAKEYLKELKLKFQEIDVSDNEDAAQEMITKSGQLGVPVIRIGDDVMVGFNKPMVQELLGIKGESRQVA